MPQATNSPHNTELAERAPAPPQVLSAMSGGVDSSVATLLLLEQGFSVIGATMRLFDNSTAAQSQNSSPCSSSDVKDARAVCQKLGIEHITLNFEDRFAACVIDPFCQSYLTGETPNPCIECNRHLKFAGLQQKRRELRADYVATGHYVQRAFDEKTGTWLLLRAKDLQKDQSYVLYHLTQEDLAHMLFPLGGLEKHQVRQLATTHGFANAQKAESQDICFIPDGDYVRFIEQRLRLCRAAGENIENSALPGRLSVGEAAAPVPAAFISGDIVDEAGQIRGHHNGLIHYTLGQRKGIGIANPVPLYVKGKNIADNQLLVAPREGLYTSEVYLRDVNVISGDYTERTCPVSVKLSYRQEPVPAELQLLENRQAVIRLEEPQVRPAPGQAAVAYTGNAVLAGGAVTQ